LPSLEAVLGARCVSRLVVYISTDDFLFFSFLLWIGIWHISENNNNYCQSCQDMCREYAKACFRILKYILSLEKEKNMV
jgi:hypothetical protein